MGMTLRDALQTRIEGKLLTFLNQKEATSERRTVPKEDGCPSRGSASTQGLGVDAASQRRGRSPCTKVQRQTPPAPAAFAVLPDFTGGQTGRAAEEEGAGAGAADGPGRACCAGSVPPFGGTSAEGRPRPAPLRGTPCGA